MLRRSALSRDARAARSDLYDRAQRLAFSTSHLLGGSRKIGGQRNGFLDGCRHDVTDRVV